MNCRKKQTLAVLIAAVLAGCSSLPTSSLVEARADFGRAQADPQVATLAAGELRQAGDSLERANSASTKGDSTAAVDHLAYVTKQHVAIARETARQKAAELAVANAGTERDRVRLDARTREADAAQRSAEISQRQSEASQRQAQVSQRQAEASQQQSEAALRAATAAQGSADAARRESEASQRSAQASQLDSEASRRQAVVERDAAIDAKASAQVARQQTQDAETRSRQLEALLTELAATRTDRGMVITLGDVLFDTNQSRLKTGGMRSVEKLAGFVKQYPQRNLLIEGFTDSTGSGNRNQELSDQRAGSVRTALLEMGVGSERIQSRGYGESFPVAGNDTATGRQLNRRVEIVVSDDSGKISPR